MCRSDTVHSAARLLAAAAMLLGSASGQGPARPLDWRKVGGTSAEVSLASPATGPVDAVWFSADGNRLYARTHSGRTFETLDYENWTAAGAAAEPAASVPATPERLPDPGARAVSVAAAPGRLYAVGRNLYRSDDGGRSWTNLTAFKSEPVIGAGQHAVAVSPRDPEQIVAANDFGVWRSLDGGRSWTGLNEFLPALPAARILAAARGVEGPRIAAGPLGVLRLPPGASAWEPASDTSLQRENALRLQLSAVLRAQITAVAASGDAVYAGASDGRIWSSLDGGKAWRAPAAATGIAVERLFVDPVEPRVALAALAGPGAHILRTTNTGGFWDDLGGSLPGTARSVTADRVSGFVYAATDRGVFYTRTDLENPASPQVAWTALAGLPAAPAADVALDSAGNQLYVALENYGVYAALAPHRASVLRVVNAADFSGRAAAPGGLVSVLGGRVSAAGSGALKFPVLAASDTESQVQVPFEAVGPNVSLALETGQGAVRLPLAVQSVSPAIFVSREGVPMLLDGDTGLMLDARNTAHSGARIQVLATGLGKVQPDWPTGMPAPLENPPAVAVPVRAFVDRMPVTVTRAVLAPGYIGFYLVELQLPAIVNAGPAELYLSAEGQESNRVQVFLEP